jgi:hypothetical protein
MDLPHWALTLGQPSTVEVTDGPPIHPESVPPWFIVRYGYPSRPPHPEVTLTWYHGGRTATDLSLAGGFGGPMEERCTFRRDEGQTPG